MKRKIKRLPLAAFLLAAFSCLMIRPFCVYAYASDGEKYITISVDATDDNEDGLQYALDTDDPEAFSDSNEFTVPSGTEHTIYVKDAAGNITSQVYKPVQAQQVYETVQTQEEMPEASVTITDFSQERQEDGQQINIDLEIDREEQPDYSDYEYLTDGPVVEAGTGTVAEKIQTDGSESSDRIFYTITTKEGEVLYLIVDQERQSDNVYLLDTVSADDLLALADGAAGAANGGEEKEDNLFAALSKDSTAEEEKTDDRETASSSNSNLFIVLLFVLAGGGAYYYFRIYKNKKEEAMDVMDAMDMEDFEPEDLEMEEADFEYDDQEKERYLAELINDDESLYDASPEEYADSVNSTEEYNDYMADYGLDENDEMEGGGL